jgi:hypothetical protein
VALLSAAGFLLGCTAAGQETPRRWRYEITTFDDGRSDGWLPGFSDFSLQTASTNRIAEVRALPAGVRAGYGYYLRGRNTSDDLFMFIKKPVSGLQAGTRYRVSFYVEFASAAPSNCVGVGGAPGESVWLKAGASTREPLAALGENGVRLTVDKGNQSSGGENAVVTGNIANGLNCEIAGGRSVLLTRTAQLAGPVMTDESGTAWVFLGTDSGFEGTTEIYYAFIAVLFTLDM